VPEQPSLLPPEDPDQLVAKAVDEHQPVARFCLFSGGGDSAVLAHRCRDHYEDLAFVDTGTAVPGVIAFVQTFAAWLGKPLRVVSLSTDEYRNMVLGVGETSRDGEQAPPLGFPGPAQHGRAYNRLKERQIEQLRRDAQVGHPRGARVLFLTGVRRAESQRRRARAPITRKGGMVFVNPLIDWTDSEMAAYREAHDFPVSEVAEAIGRSGECNCGSFAAPGEREQLAALYPEWFEERIASLEREAAAAGIPACRWGERPPPAPTPTDPLQREEAEEDMRPGPLCDGCVVRQLELGAVDKAQATA